MNPGLRELMQATLKELEEARELMPEFAETFDLEIRALKESLWH